MYLLILFGRVCLKRINTIFFIYLINKNGLNILILRLPNCSPKHLYSERKKVSQTEKKQCLNQFYLHVSFIFYIFARFLIFYTMNKLENQLKDLVLKHSGRVVFKQNDNRMIEWNGKEYEYYKFVIYSGSNWYIDDECIVTGLHMENDTLYYNIYYIGVNYKGDPCIEENFNTTINNILLRCGDTNKENVLNTLQFLINLLKN